MARGGYVSGDVSDSFAIARDATALPDGIPPEPKLAPASFERPPEIPVRPDTDQQAPRNSRRQGMPLGIVGSLTLHLLPLLLLVSWASAPAETAAPIPVQLVIETPPPPPEPAKPAPEPPKPPPRGRFASDEMGSPDAKRPEPEPVEQPAPTEEPPEPAPSETKTAMAVPPPPALEVPKEAMPAPPPPKPRPAAARPPRPAPSGMWRRLEPTPHMSLHPGQIPGPDATYDEYLAYCASLIRRHFDLLPLSMVGDRRGSTVLAVLVLDDGTIARIKIVEPSGYPDIDERIERMVAAVGHFPPLPQRFQGPSAELLWHQGFPEGLMHAAR